MIKINADGFSVNTNSMTFFQKTKAIKIEKNPWFVCTLQNGKKAHYEPYYQVDHMAVAPPQE